MNAAYETVNALDGRSGKCPACGGADGYRDLPGGQFTFHCNQHNRAWLVGDNFSSSWRFIADSDREENLKFFQSFRCAKEPSV